MYWLILERDLEKSLPKLNAKLRVIIFRTKGKSKFEPKVLLQIPKML